MSAHDADKLKAEAAQLFAATEPRAGQLKSKDRLAIPCQDMPCQAANDRRRNVQEVALGYSPEQARLEAMRCLQCRNAPCIDGCPVRINIPGFIAEIASGNFKAAAEVIRKSSLLPAVCGRVCPQETQCQQPCTVGKSLRDQRRAVSIGRLERFASDWDIANSSVTAPPIAAETGRRVAIIGSGPAGITAAADIRRAGHSVTVFEALHRPGGVMEYGIPEFRLPKSLVDRDIATLVAMGVEIRTNFIVGRTRRLADLLRNDGYSAAFVATGAGLPKFMSVPGENMVGVFAANEYLTRANLMRAYELSKAETPISRARRVAVLGGGNVAMDAARMALRLGAEEVSIVYRRTEAEMPARVEEIEHAREEGVQFRMLANVNRFLGDNRSRLTGMELLRYELGEPDESGRRRPVVVKHSEHILDVDLAVVAIGNDPNPLIPRTTPELAVTKWGGVIVDQNGMTSMESVYAGGDIVRGAATVILAMGDGRVAAAAINERL